MGALSYLFILSDTTCQKIKVVRHTTLLLLHPTHMRHIRESSMIKSVLLILVRSRPVLESPTTLKKRSWIQIVDRLKRADYRLCNFMVLIDVQSV